MSGINKKLDLITNIEIKFDVLQKVIFDKGNKKFKSFLS